MAPNLCAPVEFDRVHKSPETRIEGTRAILPGYRDFAVVDIELLPGHVYTWKLRLQRGMGIMVGVVETDQISQEKLRLGYNAYSWAYDTGSGCICHDGDWGRYGDKVSAGDWICVICDTKEGTLKFKTSHDTYPIAYRNARFCQVRLTPALQNRTFRGEAIVVLEEFLAE